MPTSMNRLLIGGLALSLLAGCADQKGGLNFSTPQDRFGEAYRQTTAAQIVDPAPQYDDPVPTTSGEQVGSAIERYRKGTVKKPTTESIGGRNSSSSSGSGSNSGGI